LGRKPSLDLLTSGMSNNLDLEFDQNSKSNDFTCVTI